MPRCRYCLSTYKPARPMQPGRVCNDHECQVKYALEANDKANKRRAKAERIAQLEDRKIIQTKLAAMRPGYLAGKAQDAVNEYVRVRDYEYGCISCDRPSDWDGQWHAGHLKTRGANSFLRYHLWNINKQCSVCNHHHSGNVAEHARGIVERYGQERLDYLHGAPRSRRYTTDRLIRIASVFRRKTRIMKKRKGIQ